MHRVLSDHLTQDRSCAVQAGDGRVVRPLGAEQRDLLEARCDARPIVSLELKPEPLVEENLCFCILALAERGDSEADERARNPPVVAELALERQRLFE